MLSSKFGVEIEFTGITRNKASSIVAHALNGTVEQLHDYYDTYQVKAPDGRKWKIMSDSSIQCQKAYGGQKVNATRIYSCELVTPILTYREDIDVLQNIIRLLRKAGGSTNASCGIHIHLDGAPHNRRSIINFINIIASRNDLFYKALQIKPTRARFCKKMDKALVEKINLHTPQTMEALEDLWYAGYGGSRETHYHQSRYHFLNLHSFFNGNHTVELRGFNSELHAGKVRAYIVFALALNHQALTQKHARYKHVQEENEKFAMRVYLNRIGFIGEEYKACRAHLYEHLSGNAAWRYGSKDQCRSHRSKPETPTETEGGAENA